MANGGEEVCNDDGQLFLGAGAEPLSTSRLQVGQPGHQMFDRPSGATQDYRNRNQEEIGVADDNRKRKAEEEIRSGQNVKGFALIILNPGSDGGSRLIGNNRNSPRPA